MFYFIFYFFIYLSYAQINKKIKDGRKQYYLIENKLYKVKKDKSQGDLFGTYIDGKIEETIKKLLNILTKLKINISTAKNTLFNKLYIKCVLFNKLKNR